MCFNNERQRHRRHERVQPQDQDLIKRAKDGDRAAFETLHRKYRKRILNYLYRFLGNYHIAEDVTQETFVNVYMSLRSYRPIGTVSSWIYKIATNLAKNRFRSMGRVKKTSLDAYISEDEKTALIDFIESDTAGPEEIAKRKELEFQVQRAIDSLPVKYKTVLILCEIEGLSYEEAAEALNCTTSVIGVRLSRARAQMRKKINWSRFT